MIKSITLSLIILLTLFLSFNLFGQPVSGDYQSKATGNWGDATTWQTFDGSTWNDAGSAPAGTSGTITIQNGHVITVAAPVTINGSLVVVNGYLKSVTGGGINAPVPTPPALPVFTFNSGSIYEHAMAASTIPWSTWNTGSTCLITGTTSASPGNGLQPFYNFIWNCPGQTTGLNLAWDNTITINSVPLSIPVNIRGDLTVMAPSTQQFRMTSAATVRNITINGNVIINGGYLTASGSSGAAQYNITVDGNISMSGGSFNLCGGSGGTGTWYLMGNLSITGGQFVSPSNGGIGTRLIFAKLNGSQSYTLTAPGTNANMNYGVSNNSTVTLNSPMLIGTSSKTGYLVLDSGKFVTTAINLITLSAGTAGQGTGVTGLAAGSQASSTGGSVEGPLTAVLAFTSSTTKLLPISKGGMYRPVLLTVTQDATTSTTYTAELINSTPPANTLPYALDGVSTSRYFHIVKGTGANVTNATIQLDYDNNDGVNVSNKDSIRIAKDDGAGNWLNLGGSGTANNTGSIVSNSFGTLTSLGTLTTNDYAIAHVNPASVASLATLTTNEITNISTTFATSGGVISNDGNGAITAKGVCWNLSGTPVITTDSYTGDGTTSTPFTSSITGLTAGFTYYVRAYATNSAGTAYGNEVVFTSLTSLSTPTIVTNAVTNISNTTATGSGSISAWGGSSIIDRGICWSKSHNPTIGTAIDYNSAGAGGEGTFTAPIGGLTLGTIYYVCAYATNSSGTSYGTEVAFTTPDPQPDIYKLVKQGGTIGVDCNYITITDAFNAVPSNYTGHWIIYVATGTYYEKPLLAAGKINVVLMGQDKDQTILTYDDYAGNGRTTNGVTCVGTSTSYSVAIDAADFQAQDITFQNTSTVAQAVALRTNGDRQSFYNCRIVGYQDTYYTWGGSSPDRIYIKDSYLEGSVDFIFGRDVALFDNCTLFCNREGGTLTAASTEAGYSYGYVFLNNTINSLAYGDIGFDGRPMHSFYLGRPWQAAPRTVFINCSEPTTLNTAGWTTMGPNPILYSEYGCYGPGSLSSRPIIWAPTSQPSTITSSDAATYTIANIFSKNNKGSGFSYAANWTPSLIFVDTSRFDFHPLPVELSSFTAETNDRNVVLKWNTSTENNSASFEVEKKPSDLEIWQKIASVKASGNRNAPKHYSFTDKNIKSSKFDYRLKMLDNDGTFKYSSVISLDIAAPARFELSQNYPNPWNPSTKISYTLPFESNVKLIIYNSIGETIKELVNTFQNSGYYEVTFDSKSLPSGVYFYSIQTLSTDGTQKFNSTKKMILMK